MAETGHQHYDGQETLQREDEEKNRATRRPAIGRLSSMAMMAGVSAKEGFLECLENEQKTECKPTFSSVIKDVEVVEGSAARFDCKIEGYPDPEVVWYKDEKPIKETRHFQIDYDEEGNCSLVISEVRGHIIRLTGSQCYSLFLQPF
ncbi:hypothetical protein KUCAC02_024714 [Chaenocephalus aceratus]|nr:hypothetical protein KUCAC02_024714 [Chaenocephalus aceratus]